MGHRNQFDQTPEEPTFFEKLAEVEEIVDKANTKVPESLLGQTDKILAEGPELPTVDELIKQENDPEVLADLIIIRDGLGSDIAEFKVRDHRRAQHPNLKEQ